MERHAAANGRRQRVALRDHYAALAASNARRLPMCLQQEHTVNIQQTHASSDDDLEKQARIVPTT